MRGGKPALAVLVHDELKRVGDSDAFRNSPTLFAFLSHVVEAKLRGDDSELKETAIGVSLYGREPDYNPKTDSIVRTHAKRVRDRLGQYYASTGVSNPLQIQLPKGSYVPSFERAGAAAARETPTQPERSDATVPATGRKLLPKLLVSAGLAVVALIAVLYYWNSRVSGPPAADKRTSKAAPQETTHVAVFRFRGQSANVEDELYGRAMADAVVSWLARVDGVNVVTLPDPVRGKTSEIEIAQRYKADYVVSGEFQKDPRDSRIRVALRKTSDGSAVFSHSYRFSWPNLVNLEDEMGEALSRELAVKLGLKAASGVSSVPPSSPAYQAYLAGHAAAVQFRQTFQLETAASAQRSLKRAIELDPNYADALADLARLGLLFAWPRINESSALVSEAEAGARKAIAIDPRHATAHAVMATAAILRFRPLEGLEFGKRGVEADPNSIPALDSVAEAYEALGLYEAAEAVYGRVARMDPAEMDPFVFGVRLLVRAGRLDDAEQEVMRAASVNAASPHVPLAEAEVLMAKGDYTGAEASLRKLHEMMAARLGGDEKKAYLFAYVDRVLALALLRQKRPDFARATLAKYGAVTAQRLDTTILLTAGLGMNQEAIRNVEISPYYQNYRYLITEPALKPLYGEDGFRALLDKSYTEWVRTLAELRESLPAQPPKLPPPGEFLATKGIRVSN